MSRKPFEIKADGGVGFGGIGREGRTEGGRDSEN